MEKKVVGIFHNPWRTDYQPRRSLVELYRRAVWLKANPRAEVYMRALFNERYPRGLFARKSWARRYGWSLWLSGHKRDDE